MVKTVRWPANVRGMNEYEIGGMIALDAGSGCATMGNAFIGAPIISCLFVDKQMVEKLMLLSKGTNDLVCNERERSTSLHATFHNSPWKRP